jgi:hypothetical protein
MDTGENALLKDRIGNWIAVTRDTEVQVGLTTEEAQARAGKLLEAIRAGNAELVPVDEELKQVLSAVVSMLEKSDGSPEERLKEADAVYKLIDALSWPDDRFGEKRDLLIECAEIGWALLGESVESVEAARRDSMTRREPPPGSAKAESVVSREMASARNELEAVTKSEHSLLAYRHIMRRACASLRSFANVEPSAVNHESLSLLQRSVGLGRAIGLFDEACQFRGELALIGGITNRLLGRFETARKFLLLADTYFASTVLPEASHLQVACERLVIEYDTKNYEDAVAMAKELVMKSECLAPAGHLEVSSSRWRFTAWSCAVFGGKKNARESPSGSGHPGPPNSVSGDTSKAR